MIGFKMFISEEKSKKYVAVQYDNDTQKKLRAWAKENGFDLTAKYDGEKQREEDFDFHTTIFFSTTEHDLANGKSKTSGSAKVVDILMLGVNNDIPVLKIESDSIWNIRKYFADKYGMKDAWDEYKPHVSVSYSKDNLPEMSKVKLPDFDLTFNELKVDDAKEF